MYRRDQKHRAQANRALNLKQHSKDREGERERQMRERETDETHMKTSLFQTFKKSKKGGKKEKKKPNRQTHRHTCL